MHISSLSPAAPQWIAASPLLAHAYSLAEGAHGSQTRATDGRQFLQHVLEVASLLHGAGFDADLVAAGLLHDAVERGNLTEAELFDEMSAEISTLVMTLSEDPGIVSFDERKSGLREQVRNAGGRAVTVFAADKLSDILGLRRGLARYGAGVERRIGTTVADMAAHYRESVAMIEEERPGSVFLPRLRLQLQRLATAFPAEELDRKRAILPAGRDSAPS